MSSMRNRNNGFTLIELLVALAAMALLSIMSWRGIDGMLRAQSRVFPLDVRQPFGTDQDPSAEQVWDCCDQWLNGGSNRAIVFRFLRHITPDGPAVNRHWTTADSLKDDVLHLFDCSHEAEAILNVRKGSFVTRPQEIEQDKLLYIQPETIRLIRLPV